MILLLSLQEKLLQRLEEHKQPETTSCQGEECVICISAKATMQTFPCAHRVVCRKCFVKTIQVAVSQRMLPLRCVVCRTRILRLNIPGTVRETPESKSKTTSTRGLTGKRTDRLPDPWSAKLSHKVTNDAVESGTGMRARVTPATCTSTGSSETKARAVGRRLRLSRSLRSIDEREEEAILSSSSQLPQPDSPSFPRDHGPGHEGCSIGLPPSPPSASFVRRSGTSSPVIRNHADPETHLPRFRISSCASSLASSTPPASTSKSMVRDASAAAASATTSVSGTRDASLRRDFCPKSPITRFPLPSFLRRLLTSRNLMGPC